MLDDANFGRPSLLLWLLLLLLLLLMPLTPLLLCLPFLLLLQLTHVLVYGCVARGRHCFLNISKMLMVNCKLTNNLATSCKGT